MTRFPEIETVFDTRTEVSNQLLYGEVIRNILKKVIPSETFEIADSKEMHRAFSGLLPFVASAPFQEAPQDVSFYCLLHHRSGVFKFFYEMLTHWLVPGKRLGVVLVCAVDFRIPAFNNTMYTLCEVMLRIENPADMKEVQRNFPTIAAELKLGLESSYQARRILEVKGLSADIKTAMIQEYIVHIINRLSATVDRDVLTEMQHVLVMCRDDFKAARDSRHLSRIIITQYLFRKEAHTMLQAQPEKRHVFLKLFRSTIHTPESEKQVLGVIVGMTFLKDKEIFNKEHLLNAIQTLIPDAIAVEHSFFSNQRGNEHFCTLYLEVEKKNNESITNHELTLLRNDLPRELKGQISYVMNPVFMPRNEEEIMRNILSLSAQIRFIKDIPQLFIGFDEQTQQHLFFNITAVRVVCPGSHSLQQLFREKETTLEYIHDRCKSVGILRKKYAKEATVFRVKLPKEKFLRRDQTIDLSKARQEVVVQLVNIIGEFRDYNGGMISKQNELLDKVKDQMETLSAVQQELLENFFYSLMPVVMRAVLEPEALKQLFFMQEQALRKSTDDDCINIHQTPTHFYAMIKSDRKGMEETIQKALDFIEMSPTEQASSCIYAGGHHYYGYIYRCDDPVKQWQYQQALRRAFEIESEAFHEVTHTKS